MQPIFDIAADAVLDTLRILPFLFVTYLLMEVLEHRTGDRTLAVIRRADRFGPLAGGLLGIIPQCGFSAAAAGFYAGGVITAGTLIAVFLSTSDEMLPILLTAGAPIGSVLHILLTKALLGVLFGLLTDLLFRRFNQRRIGGSIHDICEHEHCDCEKGILPSALRHTLHIALFILVTNLVLGGLLETVGEEGLSALVLNRPVAGELLAGLIGLIPNCAASVAITTLYMKGAMSAGAMMSGLLVGAGVGLLVLFRTNRSLKESLYLTGILYACGVLGGLAVTFLQIRF